MRKRKKKPGVAIRAAKFVIGGTFNLAEDIIVEAINVVPFYGKSESYGHRLRRKDKERRR